LVAWAQDRRCSTTWKVLSQPDGMRFPRVFFAEKTVLVGLAVWVASTSGLFGNMGLAPELSVYEAGLAKS
jgi:hypothetical protein